MWRKQLAGSSMKLEMTLAKNPWPPMNLTSPNYYFCLAPDLISWWSLKEAKDFSYWKFSCDLINKWIFSLFGFFNKPLIFFDGRPRIICKCRYMQKLRDCIRIVALYSGNLHFFFMDLNQFASESRSKNIKLQMAHLK